MDGHAQTYRPISIQAEEKPIPQVGDMAHFVPATATTEAYLSIGDDGMEVEMANNTPYFVEDNFLINVPNGFFDPDQPISVDIDLKKAFRLVGDPIRLTSQFTSNTLMLRLAFAGVTIAQAYLPRIVIRCGKSISQGWLFGARHCRFSTLYGVARPVKQADQTLSESDCSSSSSFCEL